MNIALWLARSAKLHSDSVALYKGRDAEATYEEFGLRAASIGNALVREHNIAPGDRVAIFSKNCTEYLEVLYGTWMCGGVVVPINAKLHEKEAAWIIENSGARTVFVSKESGAQLSDHLPATATSMIDLHSDDFKKMRTGNDDVNPSPRDGDDMAWLFYTSGTTGKPKGVMISHGNLSAMAHGYCASVDEVFETDTACYAAPISHGAGLYSVQHVMKGASHCVPESGGFSPDEILELAATHGDLHMFLAPTMLKRLIDRAKQAGHSGEGIRTIVYGGGPMYLSDITDAVDTFGARFCQIYGQGESPMAITALTRNQVIDRRHMNWRDRLASVGTAQSCVEVRILDEDGVMLPNGEVGEIAVRGGPVMLGYWRNEEATAKALMDGWLWTGDMGSMDDDGFVTLKDRSKDVIISGGTNIYPREVEEVLLTHDDVSEVSVVGEEDPEWGESVVAFVVTREGKSLSADELGAHCLEHIARFKRPKKYIFLDALPKNNYGKVLKTSLREKLKLVGTDLQ